MKNSYKFTLLAALGLAGVASVQAYTSGDLLFAVYQPGVANTQVYDIGQFSSLFYGESWTADQLGFSGAGFNSTLAPTAEFGIFGALTAGNATVLHTVYQTSAGNTPGTLPSYVEYSTVKSPLITLANNQGAQPVNGGTDFASSLTLGNGGLTDALGYNPATLVDNSASFWSVADDGSAPTINGYFTLDANSETLTFSAAPVPEPTTYSLLAGAGLLIALLRNKASRKNT